MDQFQLKVVKTRQETKDAMTIFFEREDGEKISYEAGQFLTFIFKKGTSEIRRSYSFSSTPGIDHLPAITIKRVVNGEISRFLIDHIKKNDLLISIAPSGRFTLETDKSLRRQIFFITAGSGITPVFSLLKKILAEEPQSRVVLIYQNHDEKSIIFKNQLDGLQKKSPQQLLWISLLTKTARYTHVSQRLNNFLLEKLVQAHLIKDMKQLFYLCGPPALMRMARFTLRLMGFAEDMIKTEHFTVEYVPLPPLIADTSDKKIMIHFQDKVHHIEVKYPTNILQAALNNHIRLPYSCRGGRCSTCAARLLNGQVKMSINEVLTEKDIREGWVLTCVGYAESDIELKF
ncbi:MAG TPA: ferredoxin--NADP reductase [Puia sp.]|nr:ferredoxin--NADP reductase [Puia sp.]